MSAIEVEGLQKFYGEHQALRGLSFKVDEGEVVGFLGPNGAGKSTAMKIITGYIAATGGTARVRGHDVLLEPIEARRHLGYLPENAPIYPDMRVRDFLQYMGRVRGMGQAERARGIDRVAQQCAIEPRLGQLVGELSKGYRQRVGLAQALLHDPAILILDEPTTGLDPNQIVDIRNLIREIGRHKTIILSTHILPEVQATCDRVIIIHRGQLVADGSTEQVISGTGAGQLLHLCYAPGKVAPQRASVLAAIEAVPGVERVREVEDSDPAAFRYEVLAREDVRARLFQLAVDQGMIVLELARERTTLEEVFRRLTEQ